MTIKQSFCVTETASLQWPASLQIAAKRFRLFVAADVTGIDADVIAAFAKNALACGMVYCSVWGPDCGRFHDVVDAVIVTDDIGERLFAGPGKDDTIMTTWHDETLEEALYFFTHCTFPTDGFTEESNFWVVISVGNPEWTAAIQKYLETSDFVG